MTIKRITFLQELLAFMGFEGRLHLEWISSAEAQKFVQVITDFTEKIRMLGPNPLSGYSEFAKAAGWEVTADFGRNKLPAKKTESVYNLDDSVSYRVHRTPGEKSKNSVVSAVSARGKENA
jgi:F420-non-reducing hydrogenase iron-sulfur subunit